MSASVSSFDALALLESYDSKSLKMDVISFNAAISSCELDRQWPTAARPVERVAINYKRPGFRQLFKLFEPLHGSIHLPGSRFTPISDESYHVFMYFPLTNGC